MSKYISVTETAALIRKVLKESYPEIKFSVKSDRYSGGASINIYYTDGPSERQLRDVIGVFEGSYFDGMIDYQGSNYAAIDGAEVRFGADYIFINREISDGVYAQSIDIMYAEYAGNLKDDDQPRLTVDDIRKGRALDRVMPGFDWNGGYWSLKGCIERIIDAQVEANPKPSATLKRIKSLGDDGYGHGCTGRIAA